MWLELAVLGCSVGSYIYHRVTAKDPVRERRWLEIPETDEGVSVPLVFGRVRVRAPVVVYRTPTAELDGTFANIVFAIGIPFQDGDQHLHRVYFGDEASGEFNTAPNQGSQAGPFQPPPPARGVSVTGIEFLGGSSTQDIGGSSFTDGLLSDYSAAQEGRPNFRGYLTAACFIGTSRPSLPDLDFEVSTYPTQYLLPFFIPTQIGLEANPAIVIAALLCDRFGKLGLSTDVLDASSFKKAAQTLAAENHGISISWEERKPVRDMINDVLAQIDGALWREHSTGKWHIKLVRADYDPVTVPELDPSNCRIENFAAGGTIETPNSLRVLWEDRDSGYTQRSSVAQSLANAVGQNGQRIELSKRYPGVKTADLAETIAARELAWESSPGVRFTSIASRAFINTRLADVVSVTYPDLNISKRIMRVVGVSLGSPSDNHVRLDLIEDVFYVHRSIVHTGGVTPFPTPPILDPDA